MSPRPRTTSDETILDAASRVLARLGPTRMRLEDVAREVGLAPATLLLRFKSKRNLLLAVAEHGISGIAEHFKARRRASPSALHAVTELCDCVRELAEAPQQLANLLAFQQLSLEDPALRAAAERHDRTLARELQRLLDEARDRGELADCSTSSLARAVMAVVRGSLLTWSVLGSDSSPEVWVRADLETLIGPYRRSGIGRGASRAPSPRPAAPTTAIRTARGRRPATRT